MRSIDLTPADERGTGHGRGPTRTGGLPYVVLAGLALGLIAMVVLGLTSKQISDREAEVSRLQQEETEAKAQADALRPFAEFRAMQERRTSTVAALATSRFDWARVMNELALVLPSDVWLINLTGSVTPGVPIENGAEITARDSVAGPALEIVGCAPNQDAVAGFVAALEDIDGVTRVGVAASEQPDLSSGATATSETTSEDDCRTRDFIDRFEIVVAFDEVPVPSGATAPPPAVPEGIPPTTGDLAATNSAAGQTAEAQAATQTYIPGG